MLGDVQPEGLLLQSEELALVELGGRDRRMVSLVVRLGLAEPTVEDRGLPGETVRRVLLAQAERAVENGPHPQPGRARRVQGAALDEGLEGAPVERLRADTLRELPDRRERPAFSARRRSRPRPTPRRSSPRSARSGSSSTIAKSCIDEFTSGGSTSISISWHASRRTERGPSCSSRRR